MSAGKGDKPRPVNGEKFRSNWDNIFKKHHATNPINPHADDSKPDVHRKGRGKSKFPSRSTHDP